MFDIGQPVKCIDNRWGSATGTEFQKKVCPNLPQVGLIYTVRWIGRVIAVQSEGSCWFIRLNEITNPLTPHGDEPIFYARQFVPLLRLCEPETDITFAYEFLRNPDGKFVRQTKEEREFFRKKKVGA